MGVLAFASGTPCHWSAESAKPQGEGESRVAGATVSVAAGSHDQSKSTQRICFLDSYIDGLWWSWLWGSDVDRKVWYGQEGRDTWDSSDFTQKSIMSCKKKFGIVKNKTSLLRSRSFFLKATSDVSRHFIAFIARSVTPKWSIKKENPFNRDLQLQDNCTRLPTWFRHMFLCSLFSYVTSFVFSRRVKLSKIYESMTLYPSVHLASLLLSPHFKTGDGDEFADCLSRRSTSLYAEVRGHGTRWKYIKSTCTLIYW